jgi:DNA invertase Pin-like site-specific DNA recombinase
VEIIERYSNLGDLRKQLVRLARELAKQPPQEQTPRSQPRVHKLERRLAPEVLEQLVADYRAGMSANQLMRSYHLGKGTVLRVLHEAGVVRPPCGDGPRRKG